MSRYYKPVVQPLESRRLMAAWQNPRLMRDVNDSALVTPLDALLVINQLNRTGPGPLADSGPSSEGLSPFFLDVNGDDTLTPVDALVVINALERNNHLPAIAAAFEPESDLNANGVVLSAAIPLAGQAERHARVTVTVRGFDAMAQPTNGSLEPVEVVADVDGHFSIDVPLLPGRNQVLVAAEDELGRTVEMSEEWVRGDVATDWNAAALNVIRQWNTTSDDPSPGRIVTSIPPAVARQLAMMHVAIFGALNASDPQFEPYQETALPREAFDSTAAASMAAYTVATSLYPGAADRQVWEATLKESLRGIADGPAKERAIQFGLAVGLAVLDSRADDGADLTALYLPGSDPGDWNRTFPEFLPPLLPHWGSVRPFAVSDIKAYRPAGPPELASPTYAEAVDQVFRLGRLDGSERTGEQTEIAEFWADGGGTATPPGHWNQIASELSLVAGQTTLERARTLALLNMAMADAGIAAWDSKYEYDLWRPIDGIRQADRDGNAATVQDANWLPLLTTPPFPSYTSGHSSFSGAAASILAHVFGASVPFATRADRPTGASAVEPEDAVRAFASFADAAAEAGISRVYGGIHFSFDNVAGLEAGDAIGEIVASQSLQPKIAP